MWVGKPAESTQCSTCMKKFAHISARNTHVKNGCPATKPGGAGELAKETRRLRTRSQLLEARLREQSVNLRAEAARDEKAKFAKERDDLTEYRKFYDDSMSGLAERSRNQQKEIERLQAEITEMKATGSVSLAAGGAGGTAAGRDATVDNSRNVVFNIYGSEEWNPDRHPGMVKTLTEVVKKVVGTGRGSELVPRVLEASIARMGDAPANRTLRGYSRRLDQVGTQVEEGRWEGRAPGMVAAEFAEKIAEAFEDRKKHMGHMKGRDRDEWADGPGGDEVVRLAVRNADRAGDTGLIFAAAHV
jgi:hypothetical protein